MYRYAQINDEGLCVGISELSGEVENSNLISIDIGDDIKIGDIFDGESWTRPEPVPYVPPVDPELEALKARQDAIEDAILMLMDIGVM